MGSCKLCGRASPVISSVIGVCAECLRSRGGEALSIAREAHAKYRAGLGLPVTPPRAEEGVRCSICVNNCVIPESGKGFCGIWVSEKGLLKTVAGVDASIGYYYFDPLPTNCVATPVCPAATGKGYPKYAVNPRVEHGFYNLAVFFAGCSLDCLFCQNWEHKDMVAEPESRKRPVFNVDELLRAGLNSKVTCVCFFGGDPGPHVVFALKFSRQLLKEARERSFVKRICWETNGLVHPSLFKEMVKLSLESGGIVKVDWKAWNPWIYEALTGVDGVKALEYLKTNVKTALEVWNERREIPILVVSMLLVPGYVDEVEVANVAEYVSSLNPETPLILLAFHPNHLLRDLPPTSTRHAMKAYEEAVNKGLKNVYVGNEWLLGNYY
ncbi:radical SAM protein [Thermosphaera chiliense]|uniref:Radical SAM protein n=2 Tax=Thermosphaera chiliense TaxID=3402707 RepID=A0A7M1UTZ7_9CREN|nr:radical SAM protein [Thermosphaera aggregans]